MSDHPEVQACIDNQSKELSLLNKGLTELPTDCWSSLMHLHSLSVSRNQLPNLPDALWSLTNLTDLDVSRNELQGTFPSGIGELIQLRNLNLMCNQISSLPDALGNLSALYRLGAKSNALETLPDSFGDLKGLVELFLTDNKLREIPETIAGCTNLVKFQVARNCLSALPSSIASLPRLELMRVAVNQISSVPAKLADAPSLAWFSLGGNPACAEALSCPSVPKVAMSDLELHEQLGEGASGDVFRVTWKARDYALKRFKLDEASPDGEAIDELAVLHFVQHPNLTQVVANMEDGTSVLMEFETKVPMAKKPNLESLLRCRWDPDTKFSTKQAQTVLTESASALAYLHKNGIAHGDVYAHNILMDKDGHCVLCDFGASFFYHNTEQSIWEPMEVRAWGLFLKDVLERIEPEPPSALEGLLQLCMSSPGSRPTFANILTFLANADKSEV